MLNLQDLNCEMVRELQQLFKNNGEAYHFLCICFDYQHHVDDMVDQDKPFSLRETTSLAAVMFNHSYWKKWGERLYLVERLVHNTYFDSVEWEQDGLHKWKRKDARVLGNCGYNMLFAVILIEFGENALTQFSLKFREYVHLSCREDEVKND